MSQIKFSIKTVVLIIKMTKKYRDDFQGQIVL